MEINAVQTIKVNAKTLKIYCKVCDNFTASLESATGTEIANQEQDYVPSFMPGNHYGDYLILDIDIDTGQITNWKQPDINKLETWIAAHKANDEA